MISFADVLNARILIVDDREANVLLLLRMLQVAGYTRVETTTTPQVVCDLHRSNRYDLILLDLQMPDMDGFQVMAGLKEIEADSYLSVLALTAQPAHELRALQAGARDFVSKPFEVAEVLMRVHNMVEVRLLHESVRSHNRTLETLALQDPLTGLANRRFLAERMRIALARGRVHTSAMAVVYVDLDGFKQVNDSLGHAAGDALLRMVAGRLVEAVRDEDTVARLGGDEFMIVLWHVAGEEDAVQVASKVIGAVSQPYDVEGDIVSITTSVGVSLYPAHGEDVTTLMESADSAMYEAKRAGRNACRVARGMGERSAGRPLASTSRERQGHDAIGREMAREGVK